MDYQLSQMRNAIDYTGRLLIIEAPDSDWTNDRMPDDFADLIGVRTKLRVLHSEYGDLDRWIGGRRVVGWSETWKVGQLGWMW